MLSFSKKLSSAGFSLVEMMTVIAIFFIITAVILANLPDFQNKTSMDLVAQDVALGIRTAQVYSTATRRASSGDFPSYGAYFTSDDPVDKFYLYAGDGSSSHFTGPYEQAFSINGKAYVYGICINNDTNCSSQKSINIFFERPKTEVQFFDGDGNTINGTSNVTIVLSNKARDDRYITIYKNGQIEVSRPQSNP